MEFLPSFYTNVIYSKIPKMTSDKQFFYRLTGGRKYTLNDLEYKILTDPYDTQMFLFYQYLIYVIYNGKIPLTSYHFEYMNTMLDVIDHKRKKIMEERQHQSKGQVKKLSKLKNNVRMKS